LPTLCARFSDPRAAFADFATPTPTPASNPTSITAALDGQVWFTELNSNKVARITPSTGAITEFATPTVGSQPNGITSASDDTSPNEQPSYITAGPDGNLWFAEVAGNKIGHISP
jgi:virginiamycin B lyase